MPSPTVDYILGDVLMHDHEAGDITDLTSTLDPRYVNITGDTMTGGLTITPATDTLTALVVNDKDANNVLTVDTINNRVGIGTTSPATKLHVNGNVLVGNASALTSGSGLGFTALEINSGTAVSGDTSPYLAQLVLATNQSGTANTVGFIPFVNSNIGVSEKRIAQVTGITDGAVNSGALVFATANAGTFGEKVRIDKSGKVGIGTTSPAGLGGTTAKLHVSALSAGLTVAEIIENTSTNAASVAALQLKTGVSSNYWQWFSRNGDMFAGKTNLADYMVIKDGGNVGIGTTSPVRKLQVVVNDAVTNPFGSGGYQALSVQNTNTTDNNWVALSFAGQDTGGTYASAAFFAAQITDHTPGSMDADFTIWTNQAGTIGERMRITNNGNVGIGTTAPAGKLHINGTADDQQLIVEAHSTQTTNIQEWQNSSGTLLSGVDGSGNLGVGTTPQSAYRLYAYKVSDGTTTQGNVYSDLAVNAGTNTSNTSSAMGFTAYKYGTGNHGNLYAINGNIYFNGTGNLSGMFGFYVNSQILGATSAGTITAIYGTYIAQLGRAAGSTTAVTSTYGSYIANLGGSYITNTYGLYVGDQSGSTNNYAILTNAGNIVFNEGGDASTDFRVESDTEANMLFVDANADTDGALYLGGSTNGLKINKGGKLTALGTATWYDDIRVEPTVRGSGTKVPSYSQWTPSGGSASGLYCYLFDNAVVASEKEVNFKIQLPHGKLLGSAIHLHVHWMPTSTGSAGDKVRWGLEYTKANPNVAFSAPGAFIYATDPVSPPSTTPTVDTHYITEFADIDMTGDALSTILLCRLFRNSSNAADSFAGDVMLLYIDCHVEHSQLGSNDEHSQ